ncbi:pentatricopeptide repeat-containing protein At4g26680, mitochondrial-like [Impatiens glandulifera]|uniref:pentatricopeptide repeat-containing protein At4g26680, mitochondrial-like n=1 Tax=Impatiens glandulifera TaxID=253017 RepID=UPI001FB12FD7|nr:pentatricopeptide repeat-containing protein At4g26680, mitochondrial-like [Impatiens glandulifera]
MGTMKMLKYQRRVGVLESMANPKVSMPDSSQTRTVEKFMKRNWNPVPIPHKTLADAKGQDLDYVIVAHSHLVHSDWTNLYTMLSSLSPFRLKHILLKVQNDHVLSLEFFNWVEIHKPNMLTLDINSIVLHILTKNKKFRSAEFIFRKMLESNSLDFPEKLFDSLLYSYRMCDSSPRIFDSLFKTYAHLRKCRNATDTFCSMKQYGILPTAESCNAYISSLMSLNRPDIAFKFYKEMRRSMVSPNAYTLNMIINALCKLGKLGEAVDLFENMGLTRTVSSYNTLICGHCKQGLFSTAMKLKYGMEKNGLNPSNVTYNTLIHWLCKAGKMNEANKLLSEMKAMKAVGVSPNIITYNTLINGYSLIGDNEKGCQLFMEMSRSGIKADILTYNALILGLCKDGKTRKAAYMVRELDDRKLTPNSSTFSALITGQCVRNNSERAFLLYKSMIKSGCHPNECTFNTLISSFCKNDDFDGAFQVLREMLDRSMVPDQLILLEIQTGLSRNRNENMLVEFRKEMEVRHIKLT